MSSHNNPDASGASRSTTIVAADVDLIEWHTEPLELPGRGLSLPSGQRNALLRLRTADGIEGQCFIGGNGQDPIVAVDQIRRVLRPMLIGWDSADPPGLRRRLPAITGHGPSLLPGWAPVDVALWDIAGKRAGVPVVDLLGRVRNEVKAYATHPPLHATADDLLADVVRLIDDGFPAYKIHPGHMADEPLVRLIGQVRDRVGDAPDLMLDPGNWYDLDMALRVGRALDDSRFAWFEDPLPVDEIVDAVTLSTRIATPVALSDAVGFTIGKMTYLAGLGTFPVLRSSSRWQGVTGLREAATVMARFGGNCEIGLGGNVSMNAANVHVMLSIDNCDYYEHWMPLGRHEFGVTQPVSVTAGTVTVSDGIGLCVVLDEDWIAGHRTATV